MTEVLKVVRFGIGALACLFAGSAAAQPSGIAERFGKDVGAQVERNYASVERLYKDIHASPELAFEEVSTAKKLANALREPGFEVTEGIGRTAVVGLMHKTSVKAMSLAVLTALER